MTRMTSRLAMCVLAGALTAGSGCASLDLDLPFVGQKLPKSDAQHPVTNIVCIWQPGEGQDSKGFPTRGFAGKVMFSAPGYNQPVQVNGNVRVHVFDDFGDIEEQKKPIHTFEFLNGAWNQYLHDTNIGAAYQLFIPYTRNGSHEASCAIRVEYESPEGHRTFSDLVNVTLAGTPRPKATDKPDRMAAAASHLTMPIPSDEEEPSLQRKLDEVMSTALQPKPQRTGGSIQQLQHTLNEAWAESTTSEVDADQAAPASSRYQLRDPSP